MAQQHPKRMLSAAPDKNNQKVIDRYNRCHKNAGMYPEAMKAKDFTAIFGVKTNSMMSNDDIEINFLKKRIDNAIYNDKEDRVYFVQIKNKTDQTIYIDRRYCFRIDSDGKRYCYYDPSNRTDTLYRKRVIAIPPHSKKNLTDYRWIRHKKGNYVEIVEYPEEFLWNLKAAGMYEGYVNYGESRTFTEDTSPFYRTFQILYSKDEDFSTYTLADINFYIKEIIGYYYPENYRYNILETFLKGDDKYSITCWLPLY